MRWGCAHRINSTQGYAPSPIKVRYKLLGLLPCVADETGAILDFMGLTGGRRSGQ